MKNLVRINKHHIPVEHIVLFEKFIANPELPLSSVRDFKSRVVMLDRDSVLTEQSVEELAEAYGFRSLADDEVAINPKVFLRVEDFAPTEEFKPSKPFSSRIVWRDKEGNSQSKLLVTKPEGVLAVITREGGNGQTHAAQRPGMKRTRTRRRTAAAEQSAPKL